MVRKTKEDAELTRKSIIIAAREVFLVRGVSRTTMEHICNPGRRHTRSNLLAFQK